MLDPAKAVDGIDRMREQALTTVIGGVADAFDLLEEHPRVIERYDTSTLIKPENINPNGTTTTTMLTTPSRSAS